MPSTVEKALDGHDYASATSSNMKMETNTSIPGNKRSRQTPTKIPAPSRRRKQDDESLPSDIALGEDVSNAAIFDAVKSLMSMVESFNSRLNENTLAIANLAKSLDFSSKEIKDCKDKMKILETQMSAVTAENKELKEQVTGLSLFMRLATIAKLVLVLPHSNADAERETKTRNSLALDGTLSSVMTIKMAGLESCFTWEPSPDIIKASKKSTSKYNKAHRS
ncbi:hypothetical protein ABVT39_000003 [Epinephelus coioides]